MQSILYEYINSMSEIYSHAEKNGKFKDLSPVILYHSSTGRHMMKLYFKYETNQIVYDYQSEVIIYRIVDDKILFFQDLNKSTKPSSYPIIYNKLRYGVNDVVLKIHFY